MLLATMRSTIARSSPRRDAERGTALALALLVSLVGVGGYPPRAVAQAGRSPIPEFTGARVYVSGVPDEFDPVRETISRIEGSSPQTYYVVVVRSTGPDKKSVRPYLERMIDQWETQARRGKHALDEK